MMNNWGTRRKQRRYHVQYTHYIHHYGRQHVVKRQHYALVGRVNELISSVRSNDEIIRKLRTFENVEMDEYVRHYRNVRKSMYKILLITIHHCMIVHSGIKEEIDEFERRFHDFHI